MKIKVEKHVLKVRFEIIKKLGKLRIGPPSLKVRLKISKWIVRFLELFFEFKQIQIMELPTYKSPCEDCEFKYYEDGDECEGCQNPAG